MERRGAYWILSGAALWIGCAQRAPAPALTPTAGAHLELGDRVGTVDFLTSCVAAERGNMNRAVALLHSFFYEEARRQFLGIAERDPSCAMAQWGVAMTYWHPIWQ